MPVEPRLVYVPQPIVVGDDEFVFHVIANPGGDDYSNLPSYHLEITIEGSDGVRTVTVPGPATGYGSVIVPAGPDDETITAAAVIWDE